MRWLAPLLVCSCSFSWSGNNPDASVPDAIDGSIDAAIDAPPDAPDASSPPCRVGLTDPIGTNRGRAGDDNGGGTAPALVCQKQRDRIIGFQMQLSDQDTVFNGPSAYSVSIACAAVSIAPDGTPTVGPVTVYESLGIGEMGWTPATPSTLTLCQQGRLMSGINVHKGNGQNGRFLDVTIHCSEVGYDGQRTGQNDSVTVDGSGSENDGSDTVDCNANEVLATVPLRKGQGIDSVDMRCTPSVCE
jgi:hypothetical protein